MGSPILVSVWSTKTSRCCLSGRWCVLSSSSIAKTGSSVDLSASKKSMCFALILENALPHSCGVKASTFMKSAIRTLGKM